MIYNKALQKITVSNDMTSLKSRIEAARLRLDCVANYNIKSTTTTTTTSAKITIREARDVDIDEVKKLVSDVFEIYMETYPTVKKFMKRSISKLPQDINNNTSINKFWVAETMNDNGTKMIIGCIGLRVSDNNTLGEVIHTCVANSYRGNGIGQMLLRNVISYAFSNSILSLHLSVMSFLTTAQALYLKMGFYNNNSNNSNNSNNDTMKSETASHKDECYIVHMKLDLKIII
jgi:N-acetylglutamate synthase-like GNAT family acetyltransferase